MEYPDSQSSPVPHEMFYLWESKHYADCVAYISEEGISVAVASPEGGLQKEDVSVIADIVLTQSEFTMEDIRVVEVQ